VEISLIGATDHQSVVIDARFSQIGSYGTQPQISAQLNIFTEVLGSGLYVPYDVISNGTLEEIDTAFRTGVISPYAVDHQGLNMVLYVRINPKHCA
jgi:hypothetical protein